MVVTVGASHCPMVCSPCTGVLHCLYISPWHPQSLCDLSSWNQCPPPFLSPHPPTHTHTSADRQHLLGAVPVRQGQDTHRQGGATCARPHRRHHRGHRSSGGRQRAQHRVRTQRVRHDEPDRARRASAERRGRRELRRARGRPRPRPRAPPAAQHQPRGARPQHRGRRAVGRSTWSTPPGVDV